MNTDRNYVNLPAKQTATPIPLAITVNAVLSKHALGRQYITSLYEDYRKICGTSPLPITVGGITTTKFSHNALENITFYKTWLTSIPSKIGYPNYCLHF